MPVFNTTIGLCSITVQINTRSEVVLFLKKKLEGKAKLHYRKI